MQGFTLGAVGKGTPILQRAGYKIRYRTNSKNKNGVVFEMHLDNHKPGPRLNRSMEWEMKKTFWIVVCLALLTSLLAACAPDSGKAGIFEDDVRIAEEGDTFSYAIRNAPTTDENQLDLTYTGFSGMETIWTLTAAAESDVTFDYSSNVKSGDFKVVLIDPEGQVSVLVNGTMDGSQAFLLTSGEYRVKVVGSKTDGKIEISINADENISLKRLDDE